MKQAVVRFAPLSLAVVIVGTVAVMLSPIPLIPVLSMAQEWRLAARIREEAPTRNAKVRDEIGQLGEHSWAGVYRTPGPHPIELAMAPSAGFTLYDHTGCGTCSRYLGFGSVLADEGSRLRLQVELEESESARLARLNRDETLHCVRWGDLQFLIPEQSMNSFCVQVADDYSIPHFLFRYVRDPGHVSFDSPPRPAGKPQVPSQFQHLIPDEPISCRIVSLLELRRRPELDSAELQAYDALYSIDAGADDGLAVGMHLFVEGVAHGRPMDGSIESVDRESGHLQLRAVDDQRESAKALVGLRATTRFERVGRR